MSDYKKSTGVRDDQNEAQEDEMDFESSTISRSGHANGSSGGRKTKSDTYYNEDLSREIVGRLFAEDDAPPEFSTGGDAAVSKNRAAAVERELVASHKAREMLLADDEEFDSDIYREEKEYIDYINSTSRSTQRERERELEHTLTRPLSLTEPQRRAPKHVTVDEHVREIKIADMPPFIDDDDDEPKLIHYLSNKRTLVGILVAVGCLVLLFFAIKLNSVNGELTKANGRIAELEATEKGTNDAVAEKEALQNEIDSLQHEIITLRAQMNSGAVDVVDDPNGMIDPDGGDPIVDPTDVPTATLAPTSAPTSHLNAEGKYVVTNGDSFWKIAVKVYGDGNRNKDIMAANGITDEKDLHPGDQLIMP